MAMAMGWQAGSLPHELGLLAEAEILAREFVAHGEEMAADRPGLLRVEIIMTGTAGFVVRGHLGEVQEAFEDCPDDYCEIEDVEVTVFEIGPDRQGQKPTYEVADEKITLALEPEEEQRRAGVASVELQECIHQDLIGRVAEYAPMGEFAATTRVISEIQEEIEEGIYRARGDDSHRGDAENAETTDGDLRGTPRLFGGRERSP